MGFRSIIQLGKLLLGYYKIIRQIKLMEIRQNKESNSSEFIDKLNSVLDNLPATLFIDTEKLVTQVLELERQEEIKAYGILTAIHKMETELKRLKMLLYCEKPHLVKLKLYELFLPSEAWAAIFTTECIKSWQSEAESCQQEC